MDNNKKLCTDLWTKVMLQTYPLPTQLRLRQLSKYMIENLHLQSLLFCSDSEMPFKLKQNEIMCHTQLVKTFWHQNLDPNIHTKVKHIDLDTSAYDGKFFNEQQVINILNKMKIISLKLITSQKNKFYSLINYNEISSLRKFVRTNPGPTGSSNNGRNKYDYNIHPNMTLMRFNFVIPPQGLSSYVNLKYLYVLRINHNFMYDCDVSTCNNLELLCLSGTKVLFGQNPNLKAA